MILRKPDSVQLEGEYTRSGTVCEVIQKDDSLEIYLTSNEKVSFICLKWELTDDEKRKEPVRVMGDAFERSYGELEWRDIDGDRCLPWYFAVSNGSDSVTDYSGRKTECFGVAVQPNAFCSWYYNGESITLVLDVRNGGIPVELSGRRLSAATVYFREYINTSAFAALKEFCGVMCKKALVPKNIIYGSNNWYYAYGNSSAKEIISDTRLVGRLCGECENKPFMVIDDGWTPHMTTAPWVASPKFRDMGALCEEMRDSGVIPGIWVRFLYDEKNELDLPTEARRKNAPAFLDCTHPAVREYIEKTVKDIVRWGYKLIKHDYSSFDISLGNWGRDIKNHDFFTVPVGFYDKSKTTAEIVTDFYKLILNSADDVYILGCNTFSHLCAGLVHANRIGDDTSGVEWERTKIMGVNTLAFRLCQNRSFYVADADCVGILEDNIPWSLNSQWLSLVAESGTSLFVSCQPKKAQGIIFDDLKKNFAVACRQKGEAQPIDWMENPYPCKYLINGKFVEYNW